MKKILAALMGFALLFVMLSCDEEAASDELGEIKEIADLPSGDDVRLVVVNTDGEVKNLTEKTGDLPESTAFSSRSQNVVKTSRSDRSMIRKDYRPAQLSLSNARDLSRALPLTRSRVDDTTASYEHRYNQNGDTVTVYNVASGDHCIIFSEKTVVPDDATENTSDTIAAAQWQLFADEFDENYENMIANFGTPSDIDENGKIIITYFDMTTYNPEPGDFKWVCGYFFNADLYPDTFSFSNNMEVVNMNLKWAGGYYINTLTMVSTLVHEFQHLINEGNRNFQGKTAMDTWLDEGLAQAAEELCYGQLETRITQFNYDTDYPEAPDDPEATSYLVRDGNSLVVWDGDYADYAMSYLFMQYARVQTNDLTIYKALIGHSYGDYQSITGIMKERATGFDDFSDVVSSYYIANMFPDNENKYGYYGEYDLTVRSPKSSVSELLPSSALYLKTDLASIESTLRLGKQGDNVAYYLVVDGDVYEVKDDKWVKQ